MQGVSQHGIRRTLQNILGVHKTSYSTVCNPLPASFLRGGTSKGIFLNKVDLPSDRADWDGIFLGIMGSPDPEYGRQLNGMGGGVSSLSKICVVGRPSPEQENQGIDVTYTFAQIGIRDAQVDYSGNCGNLSSMIGVYALDSGLCTPRFGDDETVTVRSFNTNTNKIIHTTFPVQHRDGSAVASLDVAQTSIAGVPGKASKIILDFIRPGGARTGNLLPSGEPVTQIPLSYKNSSVVIHASLVDATNPTVFVTAPELRSVFDLSKEIDLQDPDVLGFLEEIRKGGAAKMGLDPNAQAQPKIAILSEPSGTDTENGGVDVVVHALSMGVMHKAIPMTVGLCLGVACGIKHTNAWDIIQAARKRRPLGHDYLVTMKHPGGLVEVGAKFGESGEVDSAKVIRTGRRLMKGVVWW